MFGIRSLPRTLEAALRDMRHAKNETRISALRGILSALVETTDRARALSALCEVMDSDAELHVRAAAALALGDANATEAREALLAAARTGPVHKSARDGTGRSGLRSPTARTKKCARHLVAEAQLATMTRRSCASKP